MAANQDRTQAALGWREPVQARSRERVAALLDAARDLIVDGGAGALKMSDVAERAGVPIGSLYQFFPTRTALLGCLYAMEMEPIDRSLREGLAGARSMDEIVAGVETSLKSHLKLVRERPFLFAIWSSPEVDPEIRAADLENTRSNAHGLAARLIELKGPKADARAIEATALLLCHLWGSVIQLAFLAGKDAKPVLAQYVAMVQRHLKAL